MIWAAYATETVVIANTSVTSLTTSEVQQIFLGRRATIGSGERAILVTLEGGAIHEAFINGVVGRRPDQFENHWKQQVFTGRGVMPRSFSTEAEVIDFVARNSGAIAYISTSSGANLPDGVSVIEVK